MNTQGLNSYVSTNWKLITGIVGALVLVLAVAGIWNERRKQSERDATNMLYDVQTQARDLIAQKKMAEASAVFQPLLDKYPGTRAAFEANLQLGDLAMEAGSFEEAIKRYELATAKAGDSFSKLLSRYNLGIAREQSGKFQEAVLSYDEALKMEGSGFLKPEIMMAQARCFEALSQVAKAVEIYQAVQKEFAGRSYYSGAASAFEKQLTGAQGSAQ